MLFRVIITLYGTPFCYNYFLRYFTTGDFPNDHTQTSITDQGCFRGLSLHGSPRVLQQRLCGVRRAL